MPTKGQMDSGARKHLSCVHEWTGTVETVLDNEGEMLREEGLRNWSKVCSGLSNQRIAHRQDELLLNFSFRGLRDSRATLSSTVAIIVQRVCRVPSLHRRLNASKCPSLPERCRNQGQSLICFLSGGGLVVAKHRSPPPSLWWFRLHACARPFASEWTPLHSGTSRRDKNLELRIQYCTVAQRSFTAG